MGDEGMEEGNEDVLEVGMEPPSGMLVTFSELQEEEERKKKEIWRESRPWLGRGTPPTREEMIQWLRSMDEDELAANQEAIMVAEAEEMKRWAEEDKRKEERKSAKADGSGGGESSSKGKKGKGKGKKSSRKEEAEEKHVQRMEQGRSK